MKPVHVRVSGCMKIVNGADSETLYQLWRATKDIKTPYRIIEAPKTGDGDHYVIMDSAT